MPTAMVGVPHTGHGGLLTQVIKDRLNHLVQQSECPFLRMDRLAYLKSARMTQSW